MLLYLLKAIFFRKDIPVIFIIHIDVEKKRYKLTVQTRLYMCLNQLHVSAIYSHHQAEHRTINKKNYNKIQ